MSKSKPSIRRAQAAADRISRTRDKTTEARKQVARAELSIASERSHKSSIAAIRAAQRDFVKARDAELRAKLAEVELLGLYRAKREPGMPLKLTRARRRAVEAAWQVADDYSRGAAFAPVAGRSKAQRREIARAAKEAGARMTRTGVFLPRAERDINQPVGALIKDKATGFWKIHVQKMSRPDERGRRHLITHEHYLAGTDALEHEEKRLDRAFSGMKFDPAQERIRFVIRGGNVSRWSFSSMADLLAYARQYRKSEQSQAGFLNSLTIVKFQRDRKGAWNVPTGKLDAIGRSRPIKSDELNWNSVHRKTKRRGWKRGKRGE